MNATAKVVVRLTERTNPSQYRLVILVRDNRRCMALFPIWCAENVHQDIERLQEWPHQAEVIAEYMKVRREKASTETGGSQHHLYRPYRLMTQISRCNTQWWRGIVTNFLGWIESQRGQDQTHGHASYHYECYRSRHTGANTQYDLLQRKQ